MAVQLDRTYGEHNAPFRRTSNGKTARKLQYEQAAFDPAHSITITVPDVCQVCEQPSVGKFNTGRIPVMYGSKNGSGIPRKGQRDYDARLCQRHADKLVNYKTLMPKPAFNAKSPARLAAQVKHGQTSYLTTRQWQQASTGYTRKTDTLLNAVKSQASGHALANLKGTVQDRLPRTAIVIADPGTRGFRPTITIARPVGTVWNTICYTTRYGIETIATEDTHTMDQMTRRLEFILANNENISAYAVTLPEVAA